MVVPKSDWAPVVILVDVAKTATLDPIVLSLLSVFGGVALTVVAGFIGAWIQGRREHSKWQRDQRLKAYSEFIAANDVYLGAGHRGDQSELPAVANAVLRSMALVCLLGPGKVFLAAATLQEATKSSIRALELAVEVLDRREDERLVARDVFLKIARATVAVKG